MNALRKLQRKFERKVNVSPDVLRIDTLIGRRTVVEGSVSFAGNAKIDGEIQGSITVSGDLVVGEDAKITGDISAANVMIAGEVDGNITARGQLAVKDCATVRGEHSAHSLVVDEGSAFTGNCKITDPKSE